MQFHEEGQGEDTEEILISAFPQGGRRLSIDNRRQYKRVDPLPVLLMKMASVKVKLSTTILGKRSEVDLEADNVKDALRKAAERFDGKMKGSIFDDEGGLNKFLDIFVNGRNINLLNGLDTILRDGDNITVLRAVSGG